MATKKSSSAAKKKSASKKASKKTSTVKKQTAKKEQSMLFSHDESAQASLQSPVHTPEVSESSEKETGNGVYMFLVIAGVLAIAYLGYSKWQNSKKAASPTETKQEVTAVKAEEKTPAPTEEVSKSDESSSVAGFLTDKIAAKKYADAASYCKSVNGTLPSKQDLVEFSKTAPAKLKANTDKYWTNLEDGKKNAFAVRLSNGKTSSVAKTIETKVLCKN